MKVDIENTPRVTLSLTEREAKVLEHATFIVGYTDAKDEENAKPIVSEVRVMSAAIGSALADAGIEVLTSMGVDESDA